MRSLAQPGTIRRALAADRGGRVRGAPLEERRLGSGSRRRVDAQLRCLATPAPARGAGRRRVAARRGRGALHRALRTNRRAPPNVIAAVAQAVSSRGDRDATSRKSGAASVSFHVAASTSARARCMATGGLMPASRAAASARSASANVSSVRPSFAAIMAIAPSAIARCLGVCAISRRGQQRRARIVEPLRERMRQPEPVRIPPRERHRGRLRPRAPPPRTRSPSAPALIHTTARPSSVTGCTLHASIARATFFNPT